MHRNNNETINDSDSLAASIKRENFFCDGDRHMGYLDAPDMNQHSLNNLELLNERKKLNTTGTIKQFAELFSQVVKSANNTPKVDELLTAIGEIQKKIEEIITKRKETETSVEHLNDRVNELQEKLNGSGELIFLSKHPNEQEIEMLEKLKIMAKERARRNRIIKILEEQERMIKQIVFDENFMKLGCNSSNTNIHSFNNSKC